MPRIRQTHSQHRTHQERQENEARIQAALDSLRSNLHKTPGEAARAFGVHPTTLRNRWLGRRKDVATAHLPLKLLSNVQEEVLVSWCIHLSLDRDTIGAYVYALCKKYPSGSWVERFLRRHRDLLVPRSTSGNDPSQTFSVKSRLPAGYPATSLTDSDSDSSDSGDAESEPVSSQN